MNAPPPHRPKYHFFDSWREEIRTVAEQPISPEKLAVHEAAHVIVAVYLGRGVDWVAIDPERAGVKWLPLPRGTTTHPKRLRKT